LAKWGAGAPRIIESVWVGSGAIDTAVQDPANLTDLIEPVRAATSSRPATEGNRVQFVIEYRNDMHPDSQGFWINEFGVFATDPDEGRVLLCYGSLGDYPEWVPGIGNGAELTVRRYPVAIGVSGEGEVQLSFPAKAFVTEDELQEMLEAVGAGGFGPGATFVPSVSADGYISWTNNGGLPNPAPVSIRGLGGVMTAGVMATAAAGPDKTSEIVGFDLAPQAQVSLVWNETPTEMTTLNINNTGAMPVRFGEEVINTQSGNLRRLEGGHVYIFAYDGLCWQVMNPRPIFSGNAVVL